MVSEINYEDIPITPKQINKVKNALRKLTYSDPFRNAAKAKCLVAKTLHSCQNCGLKCYSGKSEKNLEKLSEEFGEVCDKGLDMDHIHPIVDPSDGFTSWDDYIKSMFPQTADAYQGLCYYCHALKTAEENIDRGSLKEDWDRKIELIYGT